MEEVQKNENGTTVPQTDGKPEKEKKPKRELTPQQIQQRRKMIVFPLMFLAFAGCMYLIFAPSGKDKTDVESVGGFNADLPLPAEDGIIADKQTAYEQAVVSRKRQDRIQSLQDFGFTPDDEAEGRQGNAEAMPEDDPQPARGGGASSATAYRNINRQLSTFYEPPAADEEKEELKRQVAELTERLQRQQTAMPTADDQLALLEKSYEIAARYMNGGQAPEAPRQKTSVSGKASVQPVRQVRRNIVSLLAAPLPDSVFAREFVKPRNWGFNTVGSDLREPERNSIRAAVQQTVTLTDGGEVTFRLLEPMMAGDLLIPSGTPVTGAARINGERLTVMRSPHDAQLVRFSRARNFFSLLKDKLSQWSL